jgi:hypothetical protein
MLIERRVLWDDVLAKALKKRRARRAVIGRRVNTTGVLDSAPPRDRRSERS